MLEIMIILVVLLFIIPIVHCHFNIDITKYEIKTDKKLNNYSSIRIVHLSDLHSRKFGIDGNKLISKIENQKPNIIVMTGDMINGKRKDILNFARFIKNINSICDVYYIMGNREFKCDQEQYYEFRNMLIKNKIKVIENNKIDLGNICIYGLNYHNRDVKEYYINREMNRQCETKAVKDIIPKLDTAKYNILLVHNPKCFNEYVDMQFDLVLAGHIHGGVIRLPYFGGLLSPEIKLFPKYDAGVYDKQKSTMCVSRGLGYGTVPFRLFNNPEIVVIEVTNTK